MQIDHVTIAGRSLDALRQQFDALGLPNDYGGTHANGVTHMATLGLADGSYIELISTLTPDQPSPWWEPFIHSDAGPCAWAVEVDDVAATAIRAKAIGVPVRGPIEMGRARPDGKQVEWDLAFLDEGEPGTRLPFVIKDRTPRDWRIAPSPALAALGLTGIARVIAATPSLANAIEGYHAVFSLTPAGSPQSYAVHGVRAIDFADAPLTLVEPIAGHDSIAAQRLASHGPSPIAFLLGCEDLATTRASLNAAPPVEYFGMHVSWLIENQLGLVQR